MSPKPPLLKLLGINLAVTLGLLGLIEAGVRVMHPAITPIGTDQGLFIDSVYADVPGLRPGAVGESNGARLRVDAAGFWHYAATAEADAPAWLFLGDSVTMAPGVAPDSSFAGRLAASVDSLRILNPSLVGYASKHYRTILDTLLARRTDLARVTVFWCLNDIYSAVPGLADPGDTVRRLGGPVLTFVRRHVRTYAWLKATFFDRPQTYFAHDRALYTDAAFADARARAFADLRALAATARRHGLAFDVVILPYEYQLRPAAAPGAFAPQDTLAAALAADALGLWDAAPALAAPPGPPSAHYLYGDGIHLSARGHAVVAAFVAAHVLGHRAHGEPAKSEAP